MLTVLEYVRDGKRIYSIEAIDVAKYKALTGQLATVAESERYAPIVRALVDRISNRAAKVNGVAGEKTATLGDTIAELDRLIAEEESGAAPSGKAEGLPSRAEALGLGFVSMHDRIFKQRIQPLDRLNRIVSLWHRHRLYSANGVRPS